MKNIAVIGADTMGNGIAHAFEKSGFSVQLIDIEEIVLKNKGLVIRTVKISESLIFCVIIDDDKP